jgi:hypothetical protein
MIVQLDITNNLPITIVISSLARNLPLQGEEG